MGSPNDLPRGAASLHRLPILYCRVRLLNIIPDVANKNLSLPRMKALLFALVRAFEFELAVSPEDLIKKTEVVQRPLVRSELEKGTQMPLIVKTYHCE